MILGAITNSWGEHLYTTDFPRLVERVRRRGAAHIELRQTYLAQYEEGAEDEWRPTTDRLARLSRTFPALTFNLAIAYPCLTREPEPVSPLFQASLEAASAVGTTAPILRLMDPARFDSPWESAEDVPRTATGIAELARESTRQGGPPVYRERRAAHSEHGAGGARSPQKAYRRGCPVLGAVRRPYQ